MKQLKLSVYIMAVIALFLAIGSLLASFGLWEGYYRSVFFIIAAAVFAVVLAICLFRYGFSLKRLGFYLCHTGVLLTVVCAFVSFATIKDAHFAIPVNPNGFYGEIMMDDGSLMEFGFDIAVADFEVEKYDAEYALYSSKTDFTDNNLVLERVSQDRRGIYDLGKHGRVEASELKNAQGYVKYYVTEEGYTLVKLPESDRSYQATLLIRDGEETTAELGVNRPYTHKGWKFYLMGYDTEAHRYVNVYVKNDPANIPFAIGLWMTIAGTFVESLSLIKRREGEEK